MGPRSRGSLVDHSAAQAVQRGAGPEGLGVVQGRLRMEAALRRSRPERHRGRPQGWRGGRLPRPR
eukprot:5355108-Alexandrium_andersonii.AAC.1